MQHGYSPRDMTLRESIFLLRQDGTWVDFVPLGAASNPDLWDACLLETAVEVVKLLETDKLDAEIYPLEVTPEALSSWLTRTAGFTAQQRIDNLVSHYKERLRNKK